LKCSGRRSPSASVKRGLLAGAALAVFWSAGGHAQGPAPATTAETAARGPDGLAPDELYMEADLVVRDGTNKVTTASGDVEVRYQGRTLRAQELVYDEAKSTITANGDVQTINADGTVEFADKVTLDEDMKAGVAIGFSSRQLDNIKIAAATAVRRNETIQELNRAIYTPCEICADNKPKSPTWSIAADKVVQDKKRQLIYYRNATVRVKGVPIVYLPVFWHADPTAERKSGFLAPRFEISNRRGFSYEQPYLLVVSPYSDVVISPQFNAEVDPFLNLKVRKRFYSGDVEARFGYTYSRDFDSEGEEFGERTSRSYILADGAFQASEHWRWGFTAERVSDDLIFDKYDVNDAFLGRGLFVPDDRRLISQLYTTRQDQRSWFSAAAFTVQGLRPGDNDRTFPIVSPYIEARWEPEGPVAGGRLRLRGGTAVLTREQSQFDTSQRLPGVDSVRGTVEADWRRTFTSDWGLRAEPFADLRTDIYSLNDMPGPGPTSNTIGRGLAVAGVDVTYPLYRRFRSSTVVLEPLVQVAVSPNARQVRIGYDANGAPVYLNEDSLVAEFDETNLFRANKFPGFDLYEDGARLNVGARASVLWDDGRRGNLLVGRSFRAEENDIFSPRVGLRGTSSDWVIAADAEPIKGLSVFGRTRLESDTLDVRRAEAGADYAFSRGSAWIRYLRDNLDINGVKRENVDLGGQLQLTKNWGVTLAGSHDLVQKAWVTRDMGVFWTDDCTRIDVIYRREDTVIGRLGPSDSIAIRLTLATLGEPIYAN
jgi:LPS-assembly protein